MNHQRMLVSALLTAVLGLAGCCGLSRNRGPGAVDLFNGRDLEGWSHVLADPAVARDQVWSVREGMIVCRGEPVGYIGTAQAFVNFRLSLEYRWAPGTQPGNSGVFSRINGAAQALPRCVETQLKHGDAGDVMGLQGMTLRAGQPRYFHVVKHPLAGDIDGVKKLSDRENPPGAWNRLEIRAAGGDYTVWLNGVKVNEAHGVEVLSGPIGLQSEGGEIHFRGVRVTPMP